MDKLIALVQFLEGKKSYIISFIGCVSAFVGFKIGVLTPEQAFQMFLAALGLASLRNAIK